MAEEPHSTQEEASDEAAVVETGEDSESVADATEDDHDVKSSLRALETVLRKTRRRWRSPALLEGLLWYLVTIGAVLATALLAGFLSPQHARPVVDWILAVGCGSATLVGLVVLVQFWRSVPELDDIASLIQRHHPDFRSDIVAALQFGRTLSDRDERSESLEYSEGLAKAHVERTARTLLGATDGSGSVAGYLPQRDLSPALLALSGCLVLLGVPYFLASEQTREILAGGLHAAEDAQEKEADRRPIAGDIDLYFTYPRYTDLPVRFEAFTTGHIETLVGTEVTLKTYPLVNASSFEIVLKTGDAERVIPLEEAERGRLKATFLVTKPGSYSLRAKTAEEKIIEDGIEREISLIPDQPPEVMITSHEGEQEVSPEDVIEFDYTISDDFGIEAVHRVHGFAGEEDKQKRALDLPELSNFPSSVDGKVELDLTPLGLQPKDIVVFQLEAADNNSLTGPGVGRSQQIVLRVASPEDKHMKVIAAQQAVMEALLMVLADYLEAPIGERRPDGRGFYRQVVPDDMAIDQRVERYRGLATAHQREKATLDEMEKVVGKMKDDPLMLERDVTLFSSLYQQLYGLHRDGEEILNRLEPAVNGNRIAVARLQTLADHAAKTEDALEKGILRLEELLATQKMDAIQASAKEIEELKDRLKELLEKYRDTRDPELKKAIEREIQRLRQRMGELLQRMQSQLQKLPEEHVNMEAVKQAQMESDAQKLGDNLQSIEEMLDRGDIDGALEALENMSTNLDELTKQMDSEFANAQPEGLSELDKKLSELMDSVDDLENLQRDVESETEEARNEIEEKRQQELDKMLERSMRELEQMVEAQKAALDEMAGRDLPRPDAEGVEEARQNIQDLQKMLGEKDVEQSLKEARESIDDLRSLEFSMELSERYSKGGEKPQISESLKGLQKMLPRGQRIARSLENLMEQARQQQPRRGSQRAKRLAGKQKQVHEQAQKLGEKIDDASEKFPMLEQQLKPSLQQAGDSMEEARRSLDGEKMQRSLDHQRSALDELGKLKQSMKDTLQKRRQEQSGKGKSSREKVAIPDKDSRDKQLEFREEVMKGMKEGKLQNYESEIENYYKSLME